MALGGLSACGDERTKPETSSRAATSDPAKVVARSARLSQGGRVRLLRVPGVGRLRVKCDDDAVTTTFVTGERTATMDVVVDSAGQTADTVLDPGERFSPRPSGLEAGLEHWQFAEFAKAQATVATIDVAIRAVGEEGFRCAVSAKANVFASTLGTLTR
jgi:hypothetical protein